MAVEDKKLIDRLASKLREQNPELESNELEQYSQQLFELAVLLVKVWRKRSEKDY